MTPDILELVIYWYSERKKQQANTYEIKGKQKRVAWADIGTAQADVPVTIPT